MRVLWTSSDGQTPTVKYKKNGQGNEMEAKGSSETYTMTELCDSPANKERGEEGKSFWNPGYTNNVLLDNLEYNTYYTYKFGNEKTGYSNEFRFKSPKEPGFKETSFIMFGDLGSYPLSTMGKDVWVHNTSALNTRITLNQLYKASEKVDLMVHIGDINCKFIIKIRFLWIFNWMGLLFSKY
jgi:hypothetical protein